MEDQYRDVALEKWTGIKAAFREAPQAEGRFTGTREQQDRLAQMMRELFDGDGGDHPLRFKYEDTLGLAQYLETSHAHWSIGQYLQALGTLMDPDQVVA